jgi:succinylglutamate desuccinylase
MRSSGGNGAARRPRLLGDCSRGVTGPLLIATGGVHGNEPSGVEALERVFAELERLGAPLRGRFVGLAGNLASLERGARYVDEDLNRLWTSEKIAAARAQAAPATSEVREQRELLAAIEALLEQPAESATLLDLHSTSGAGPPFAILSDRPPNRRLVEALSVPAVFGLHRDVRGTLNEWFDALGHTSVVLEGGQNADPHTRARHEAALWTALASLGMLAEGCGIDFAAQRAVLASSTAHLPGSIDVCLRWGIEPGERFRMEPGFTNLQRVQRGELLARTGRHGEIPIRSPFDGMLLMPLYQEQGNDGFFLGLVPRR